MAILKAAATANFVLDNTVDTLITGLSLTTPPAGDYLLWCTIQFAAPGTSTSGETLRFNVYVGGVLVPHTERSYEQDASLTDAAITYAIGAIVSPNGAQDVEIRHRASSILTARAAQNRELTLLPALVAPIEVSATGDAATTSTSFAALMTATTPRAGTYVCTFGTSGKGPSTNEVEFRVTVGGVEVAHSIRATESEVSVADRDECLGTLAVVVTPDGTEDVVIEWRLTAAVGTRSIHQRTMTLTPTDPIDVNEASSVADDSESSTAPVLIDGMTITDPGAADYLVLFTSYDFYGVIGTDDAQTGYTMRENGVQVPDSVRRHDHEESIDSVNMNVQAGGRVTATSGNDIEMFWQNATTTTRTIHQRTLVAIRERPPFLRPQYLVRQAFGAPRAQPGPYLFRATPVGPAPPPPVTMPGFMVVMGVERFPRTREQGWTAQAPRGGVFSVTPLPGVSTGFVGTKFLN